MNSFLISLGQVGYITCGMKTIKEALIGDTLYDSSMKGKVEPFPGFKVFYY